MPEPIDAYKVLQVDPEAEDEVIQAAYRRLARKYHPDLADGEAAVARMAAINAAWDLIGEPFARAAYDRSRTIAAGGGTAGGRDRREGPVQRPGDAANAETGDQPQAGRPSPPQTGPPSQSRAGRPSPRQPDTVSRDWTPGRSTVGGGFDESMRTAEGLGAAGPPPGPPTGSVLNFGRYNGWSLGEIARRDLEYIEWLERTPIGRTYREELDAILRASGRRRTADAASTDRRGLFRRR